MRALCARRQGASTTATRIRRRGQWVELEVEGREWEDEEEGKGDGDLHDGDSGGGTNMPRDAHFSSEEMVPTQKSTHGEGFRQPSGGAQPALSTPEFSLAEALHIGGPMQSNICSAGAGNRSDDSGNGRTSGSGKKRNSVKGSRLVEEDGRVAGAGNRIGSGSRCGESKGSELVQRLRREILVDPQARRHIDVERAVAMRGLLFSLATAHGCGDTVRGR